jgi:hypothetical protein
MAAPRLLAALVLLGTAACVENETHVYTSGDGDEIRAKVRPSLESARELDQEGVRAFKEGRYADAVRYFSVAYRMGGPPSELWNMARARERMDQPEEAARAIEEYLGQRDLSASDRADGERELHALHTRPSMLTVMTNPPGAVVTVDGKQTVGPTPVSVAVRAGPHTIAVHHEGCMTVTRPLEARFGRAVIVSLDLSAGGK